MTRRTVTRSAGAPGRNSTESFPTDLLRISIPRLQIMLAEARSQLWSIDHTDPDPTQMGMYRWHLEALESAVTTVLEAAGLNRTRRDLQAALASAGLREPTYHPDADGLQCSRLDLLHRTISGLDVIGSDATSLEQFTLNQALQILRSTGQLLQKKGVTPTKERHVQDVMNDYLAAAFPDQFTTGFKITGVVKNFEPDAGLRNVGLAIEYKYASSNAEARERVSSLFEDTAGYRGSKDWYRFVSVLYMPAPYITEDQIKADFDRVGAIDWTPIVIVGATTKRQKQPTPRKRKQA